jgi:ribonucleoside-diphosphate reductase alpha chain
MTDNFNLAEMAERLDDARKLQGLSFRKASLGSGLSETYLHAVVKLGRDPSAQNLVKICNYLGVSVSWAMYGQEASHDTEELLRMVQDNPAKRDAILALLQE